MKVIWKYPLEAGNNEIKAPVGAKPVHVAAQDSYPCLWIMLCPTDQTWGMHRFYVAMTEEEFDSEEWDYFGTVHISPYVLHVLSHA